MAAVARAARPSRIGAVGKAHLGSRPATATLRGAGVRSLSIAREAATAYGLLPQRELQRSLSHRSARVACPRPFVYDQRIPKADSSSPR